MTDLAIRVEHLSKRYRIGQYVGSGAQYKTLRESLTNAVSAPLRRLRQTGDGRRKTGPPSPASRPRSSVAGQPSPAGFIWALKDVSFEVKQGEVLGIIGRNGAGKSTLLKVLTRITEPTEGRAVLSGRVNSLLEVGTGFHPELTGRENVRLSGAILGMTRKEIDRKFDEIVDFSGIETYIDTPVKRYSSGMRVRLGFAVAAHLEPEILLIDEVLAVGDAEFQRKCLGKMEEVTGEGRTVLFVSHNMPSIEALCHRAILLEDGQIAFRGDSAATVTHYLGEKELPASSYTDLRTHPGRTTKSKPIFQSIRLLNDRREETAVFRVGERIVFEMALEVGKRQVRSPRVIVGVYDSRKRYICRFDTRTMMAEPPEFASKNIVRCFWNTCRLAPGKYYVNLLLGDPYLGKADHIQDAMVFEVLPTDIYGTGKSDEESGVIMPKGKWEFVKGSAHQRSTYSSQRTE